jgi:chaperonin GroEL (HSP60 family)
MKDGTEDSSGKGQIISNINACQAVVDVVKTTLGKSHKIKTLSRVPPHLPNRLMALAAHRLLKLEVRNWL